MRIRSWGVLGLLLALAVSLGYGPATDPIQAAQPMQKIKAEVAISNEVCRAGVTIASLTWLFDGKPVHFRLILPPAPIPLGTTMKFTEGLAEPANRVRVVGTGDGKPFDFTAPLGESKYPCGSIKVSVEGEPPKEEPRLPKELADIFKPGIHPREGISGLQGKGAEVKVFGSETKPKVSDAADPLIIGALGPGFTAAVYWIGSGTGFLRTAVLHDQPAVPVVLIVIGLPFLSFCASIPPPFPPGGLTVFCDRPAAFAPATTIIGGPVPGAVFAVFVIKIGGPTLPFVLSLAG